MHEEARVSADAARGSRRWGLFVCATLLLAIAHWAMATSAVSGKSNVFDETLHQTGGFSYWTLGDYRIHPENGNLPQRLFALPLVWSPQRWAFPSTASPAWRRAAQWTISYRFFFEAGNDFRAMLRQGRALAAGLGALVVVMVGFWSRRCFGEAGGLLSATLAAFSPNLLANAPLMTSDVMLALLLCAALGAFWVSLHRIGIASVLGSGALLGALFATKYSAPLIVPMALVLAALRLLGGRPLRIGRTGTLTARPRQAAALAGLFVAQGALVLAIVWGVYGFRYAAIADGGDGRLMEPWESLLATPGAVAPVVAFAREHRLLPEAYLYGLAFVDEHSRARSAFLRGEFGVTGWWWFFPYAFAVKTPLALFGLLGLGALGWARAPDARAALHAAAPLLVLLVVYWGFSLTSSVNVGLRHLLPVYPALFVLAGSAAGPLGSRARRSAAAALLLWFVGASLFIRPHYLAYFNESVGPAQGYRHLVDSSLDWGQELPGLAAWLDERGPDTRPVYLSYFGSSSPEAWGVRALPLPSYHDWPRPGGTPAFALRGGTYCISATNLQTLYTEPRGPWTAELERLYQAARRDAAPLFDPAVSAAERNERLRAPPAARAYQRYHRLRFARLAAWLRRREPDAQIGYSMLIYRLDDDDLRRALEGPAPGLEGRPGGEDG